MRVAVATCAPSAFAVADLYSRPGEPKDPLLEDEGDEQVDAVGNNRPVLTGSTLTFWLPAGEVPTGGTHSATVVRLSRDRSNTVSGVDKAKNKAQNLGGKAKEAVGKVTGDTSTENEGKGDQAKSNLKDAGEKVKDAFKK